jgi:DNA-binding NtrC family response regulator
LNILVFSSVPAGCEGLVAAVREPGHEVMVAETAGQTAGRLARGDVGLLIVDLAGTEGLRFLRKHSGQRSGTPILCLGDRRRPDASAEALRLGAVDIIARPIRADEVTAALANAREFTRVAAQGEAPPELPEHPDGVFGTSSAMRDVLGIVRRVAPSQCGVLIVGEHGTGREMVARAIHAHGPRRDRPFLKIPCSDVDSAEFAQLLAGAAPPGSTIYLEELGGLVPDVQPQLETVLRQWETTTGAVPPRILASAQSRIFDAAVRGAVRRGLLEAIAVVRIDLAPLRQRAQDIPLLAMHFLKDACRRADTPPKTFSRSALTLLAALPWPGNAAELRSLTERLAVLVQRGVILLEDVLANVRLDHAEALGRPRETLREARERFERDYITAVLQHHRGRMAEAARDLGIERTNLYRKIKQLNIRWVLPG